MDDVNVGTKSYGYNDEIENGEVEGYAYTLNRNMLVFHNILYTFSLLFFHFLRILFTWYR